jgi:NAD(P)-dependent dehydrogenase (short-subunit alcohol dehydrogenase family)
MATQLITGANRGLGLANVTLALAAGDEVIAAVRDLSDKAELDSLSAANPGRVQVIEYDARDAAAPARVKAAIGDRPVDILFSNAGMYGPEGQSLGHVDGDGFLDTIAVNVVAPLRLAEALADNVAASTHKVIANQSSRMGSIADNGSGGFYAYRASKAALNAVTKSLSVDLASKGITVIALHPGWVKTRMGGPSAPIDAETSARGQQKVLRSAGLSSSGKFFDYDGSELPW